MRETSLGPSLFPEQLTQSVSSIPRDILARLGLDEDDRGGERQRRRVHRVHLSTQAKFDGGPHAGGDACVYGGFVDRALHDAVRSRQLALQERGEHARGVPDLR